MTLAPMSPKRRDRLAASGLLNPGSTFARRPSKRKKAPTDTGPDQATVDAALERDAHSCVVCGGGLHGERGRDWSIHHRRLRSQGGTNRLSNTISVCGNGCQGCHGNIHGGPAAARRGGWMVSRDADPRTTPMAHALLGFVYLADDGSWSTRRPAVEPAGGP